MLNPRKRITKRELKQDPLVTNYFKALDFIESRRKELTYWGLGIAAVIVIAFFVFSSGKEAELQAVSRVGQVEMMYMRGQFQEAAAEFQNIVQQYPDTDAAGLATFYLANSQYYMNQYDQAIEYYRKYIDDYGDDPDITASCYAGLGACLENQGKLQEALAEYRNAINAHKDGFAVPQYMLNIARCDIALDKSEEARAMYQEIIDTYANTPFSEKAESLMAQM